jgi:glucose-1-phosphatase
VSHIQPKALLFDLGGVMLRVDIALAFQAWARYSTFTSEEIATRFRSLTVLEDHERGAIDDQAFFLLLRHQLSLDASVPAIEAGWNSIFVSEIEPTRRLAEQAGARVPCYALTNSTASHLATWPVKFPELAATFNRVFASFQLGYRKPEAEAFLRVCTEIGLQPAEVVFFDDSPTNAAAARAVGMSAIVVSSAQDVEHGLRASGVLQAEA